MFEQSYEIKIATSAAERPAHNDGRDTAIASCDNCQPMRQSKDIHHSRKEYEERRSGSQNSSAPAVRIVNSRAHRCCCIHSSALFEVRKEGCSSQSDRLSDQSA